MKLKHCRKYTMAIINPWCICAVSHVQGRETGSLYGPTFQLAVHMYIVNVMVVSHGGIRSVAVEGVTQ